jgi:hypothetical protein
VPHVGAISRAALLPALRGRCGGSLSPARARWSIDQL